jgi:hypothetical protein
MALFPTGPIMATPGARDALETLSVNPVTLVRRHISGDWGDVDEHDAGENRLAVNRYLRIFSVYKLSDEVTIWLITEADRSVTTFLLPEEY